MVVIWLLWESSSGKEKWELEFIKTNQASSVYALAFYMGDFNEILTHEVKMGILLLDLILRWNHFKKFWRIVL